MARLADVMHLHNLKITSRMRMKMADLLVLAKAKGGCKFSYEQNIGSKRFCGRA